MRDKGVRTANTTSLASYRLEHEHADDQSKSATDFKNKQKNGNVLAFKFGVGYAVEATSRIEKSRQRQNDTFSPSVVPQALHDSAAFRNMKEKIQNQRVFVVRC